MGRLITSILGAVLLACLAHGSKCPEQGTISRSVLCYYEGRTSLNNVNLCNCTHIILTNVARVSNNYTLDMVEGAKRDLQIIQERKPSLIKIFTVNEIESSILESESKARQITNGIADFLHRSECNGVELNFPFTVKDTAKKDSVTSFVKLLKKTLENSSHSRVKRAGYDVSENLQDDITTAPYRTPTAKSARSSDKHQTSKKSGSKRRKNYRGSTRYGRREQDEEPAVESWTERRSKRMRKALRESNPNALVLVRIPNNPEIIAKKFDLKILSKYADMLVVSTHDITDESESKLTYHPSRLMGLSDMLNADSILDFLTGLGVTKSKVILTLPAAILKFQLDNPKKTTPRSPRVGEPIAIDQSELCALFAKGNWTVERDDDLTAPYAFSDKTWLAYEDKISVSIKAKYILLRELAGGAIYSIDADIGRDPCNDTSEGIGFLTNTLYKNMMSLERKPRGLVLESLQQDIHDTSYSTVEAGVHLSEYRIVRVVDHSGAVHVIRKNTKTQFECSRQGYFSHPLGCNKFYRCVKFNQYTDDFTVFEYDCPAGLAFDERWEVCVWPGSLPHGAPCTGSSEIAPVPRSHYQCPNQEGYYADPENCRWFFACLDHARDGVTPLTAYEFRCPFGLVFNEQNLVCDWPWNVGVCGNRGFSGVIVEHHGGSSSSLQSATFVNSGAYQSSFGSASGHGVSGFEHSGQHAGYQVSSGFFGNGDSRSGGGFGSGYIASHFDDNQNRASFGTVPEYEVSGGRILNKGSLVLNHNVNLHGASGGFNKQSGSFSYSDSGRSSDFDSAHVNVATPTPVVHTVQTVTPAPAPAHPKLSQFVYNPPLSSPRPFSLHVPEVQINEEHSSGAAYVAGSTTQSPDTVVYVNGAKSGSSGNVNTFAISSESGEYIQQDAGFGNKINVAGPTVLKNAEVDVSTAEPILEVNVGAVHSVSNGYDSASHVTATTAGYDHASNAGGSVETDNTVSVTPKAFGFSNGYFSSGGNTAGAYSVSSTTPAPDVFVEHDSGVRDATVLITPEPKIHTHQQSDFHKTAEGSRIAYDGSLSIYGAQNGTDTFVHRPAIEVSTIAPPAFNGFASTEAGYSSDFAKASISSSSAGNGFESNLGSKSTGNAILLEEHIERVVIPKVVPSVAPVVAYEQPSVSVKPALFSGTPKTTVIGTAVTPSTVTVEKQDFIGPIHYSSPAPLTFRKEGIQKSVSSADNVFKGDEYLPPVQSGLIVQQDLNKYQPAVQPQFVQPAVSTPATPVFKRPEFRFRGRVDSKVPLLKPAIQQVQTPVVQEVNLVHPVVSTQTPSIYKAPEYLPPVESGAEIQKSLNQHTGPAVEAKLSLSTPAPTVFGGYEFGAKSVTVEQGRVDSGITVQVSTPGPSVFKASTFQPQTGAGVSIVQQKVPETPIVETKLLEPVVSTPAPAVFKSPEFVSVGGAVGQSEYKSSIQHNIQTYSQVPVVEEVKVVQPVVSTPAPTVDYVAVGGIGRGRTHYKSSIQQNVQTYAQVPDVNEVKLVEPVSSTPAPNVFNAQEFVSGGGYQGGAVLKSVVQENIQTFSQAPVVDDVKLVQPIVSTPTPAVDYVAVGGGGSDRTDYKSSSIQHNIHSYSQGVKEVKVAQPVSTPSPTVFKGDEYLPPVQSSVGIQKNVHQYRPSLATKVVQPVVSTLAPTVFRKPVFVPSGVEQGRVDSEFTVVKPGVQKVEQVPTVYKAPEYLPPLQQQNVELKSIVQENVKTYSHAPVIEEVKFAQPVVSTPAPSFVPVQQSYVQSAVLQDARGRQQQQHFEQTPVRSQSFSFVPSTTVSPIVYGQKQLPETVAFSPLNRQQNIFRSRAKSKQLFSTIVQPQVSISYQQPAVPVQEDVIYNKPVTTPATLNFKTPSPTPAQVFGYQSTSSPLIDVRFSSPKVEVSVTPKPVLTLQPVVEKKFSAPLVITDPEKSTPKPYIYEEYVQISSPNPKPVEISKTEHIQQPIIVAETPKQNILQEVLVQPKTVQQKTIYYENFEKSNPVVTALEKEVVQPVVQQEIYQVSTESPVIDTVEETVGYHPSTGQEIENYSNFEFQKIGRGRGRARLQGVGTQSQSYETGQQVSYKVNSNIEIAPPSEEYLLAVTPKFVTTSTTAAPIRTTTYRARTRPTTTYNYDYESYARQSKDRKATIISVGQVDKEELDDDNVESLLQKYSGDFGNVLGREKFVTKVVTGEERGEFVVGNEEDASTVGYDVSKSRFKSRGRYESALRAGEYEDKTSEETTASLDLKNLKLRKNKKTVIIVSQVSDANPLLIGKLAGQCSCQSNKLQLKKIARVSARTTTSTTYAPPQEDEVTSENILDSLAIEAVTPKTSTENVVLIDGSRTPSKDRRIVFPRKGRPSGRSRSRYDELTGNEIGQALFTPVSADEIAGTGNYAGTKSSQAVSGVAFDRYSPGGLRELDENLQGSVDCERPGLFRHPKYCNKFYACNYDPWKKKYTLHVFNCPIHLSYDSSISACNWPSKGPACSDDHLLL